MSFYSTLPDRLKLMYDEPPVEFNLDIETSLYHFSKNTGIGKTYNLVHYGKKLVEKLEAANFTPSEISDRIALISCQTLSDEWLKGQAYKDQEARIKTDQLRNKPILLLDDLGAEGDTPGTRQFLISLISYRHENMLFTGISSNLDLEEVAQRYNKRTADRIFEMCKIVENKETKNKRLTAGIKNTLGASRLAKEIEERKKETEEAALKNKPKDPEKIASGIAAAKAAMERVRKSGVKMEIKIIDDVIQEPQIDKSTQEKLIREAMEEYQAKIQSGEIKVKNK